MHLAVYLPFLGSALLGAVAPVLARRLPPATATRLLVASALGAAASSLLAVGVLALTLVGRMPTVATVGHWSAGTLGSASPVPPVVGGVAVAGVVAAIARGSVVAVRRARALLAARAFCRDLGGFGGQLVVTDEDIQPVAVPTGGGRILASRAHLAALPAAERRALLLHEQAHLSSRHHLYRLAADLAGTVDPLQHRVRRTVRYSTERWADEVAAAGVGNRAVVAAALARSSLRSAGLPAGAGWEAVALAAGGPDVARRVRAMLAPAPSPRPVLVLAACAVVACTLTASLHAQEDSERYLQPSTSTAGVLGDEEAAGGR